MSICTYICICKIHTYLYLYTYIHIYMYTYAFIWVFICMYAYIYLSVCAWIYLNSLITLLCVLQGFLTKNLARTVIQLLTHIFKNHSVTDWKSRRRILQIGLLLSETPWVCLSCRDLHRPFKFAIRAAWNQKISLCSWHKNKFQISKSYRFPFRSNIVSCIVSNGVKLKLVTVTVEWNLANPIIETMNMHIYI